MNRLGVELSGYSSDKIFYGFYDINSDGTEELLIGYDYSGSDMTVMDIYAYDGSIARKLMYDDTMTERSPTKIYGDGTIYKYSSGGAQYGGAYFYKLNQPEYAAVLYEFYRQDGAAYPATPYYNETEQLTQEQFDAKIAALGEPISIVWNNIATDTGAEGQTDPAETAGNATGNNGEESQPDTQAGSAVTLPIDQVAQMVVDHYNAQLEEGDDSNYVIFESQMNETDTQYEFELRFQIGETQAEEIIAGGGMPSANRLVDLVFVNKSDGTVTMSFYDTEQWNLWDN